MVQGVLPACDKLIVQMQYCRCISEIRSFLLLQNLKIALLLQHLLLTLVISTPAAEMQTVKLVMIKLCAPVHLDMKAIHLLHAQRESVQVGTALQHYFSNTKTCLFLTSTCCQLDQINRELQIGSPVQCKYSAASSLYGMFIPENFRLQ